MNDKDEAAAGTGVDAGGQGYVGLQLPGAVFIRIEERIGYSSASDDGVEVAEIEVARLLSAIDAGHVPGLAAATGDDGVVGGIAADEACFVPHGGQLT